ncbi:MAG: YggS family pyridoxal phosphate-dependent enzyme [Chloroflexi bacterium]|nr:YggS family pyridoxal phosphate-dependent enzyme [Chloroflexota bacterium]
MADHHFLRRNLEAVQARVEQIASRVGRDISGIRLVVVTKGHPVETVQALLELGVREVGESYVEEGREKQDALGPLAGLQWHMIGHVQSRKAEAAARHFDMIHSVDSLKLARRLDRFASKAERVTPILLECNVSGEHSKHGWPAWEEGQWPGILPEIEELLRLPNVRVHGLMSLAPYLDDMEKARPYFARTRNLRDYLAQLFPQAGWSQLSMGMSGDFEAAIMEGATILRIGTAIVGPRRR